MAIPATLIHEVRTTGNDANGGGFDPANANFATDGTVDTNTGNTASPVFSSASYNFVTGDIGAWLFIKSGTNSIPGWYQIASVGSNKATLTASVGSAVLSTSGVPSGPSTAAGIATVGTPTNLTWGVDYSQQASAQIAYTDMVIGTAGAGQMTFTSAGNPVGKNIIGNVLNVTGGTGFTVQRVVISSTSGTTATVVATGANTLGTAASTGGTGNLGGCYLSLGQAGAFTIANHLIYITGSFTISSASNNVSGGCFSTSAGCGLKGYGSLRTDTGRATLTAGSTISSFTVVTNSSTTVSLTSNLIIDGNNYTTSRGIAGNHVTNCKVSNCKNNGISATNVSYCEVTGCSTTAPALSCSGGLLYGCYVHDNTVTGVWANSAAFTISESNTGGSSSGFDDGFTISAGVYHNCTAYGNGLHGFRQQNSSGGLELYNCISYGNSGYQVNGTSNSVRVQKCALGTGGSGAINGVSAERQFGNITLTADPFTNASGGDFSLNNTAGGGAELRAASLLGAFPGGTTTGYLDIGAAQHQDAGGGSGGGPLIGGRLVQA